MENHMEDLKLNKERILLSIPSVNNKFVHRYSNLVLRARDIFKKMKQGLPHLLHSDGSGRRTVWLGHLNSLN